MNLREVIVANQIQEELLTMNRWQEQFENHPIHETLREIEKLLEVERQDMTHDERVERRRFLKIISTYQEILSQLDPEIIPPQLLDNINSQLRGEIFNQLTLSKSHPGPTYLRNANDQISNLLGNLCQLLAMEKKSVSEKPLRDLEKLIDDFSLTLNTKKEKFESELNKISTAVYEYERQINDLSNTINAKKQETDTLISEWQKQFSHAQDTRSQDFIRDQKNMKSEYEAWREKTKKDAESKINDILSEAKGTLEHHQKDYDHTISQYLNTAKEKHQSILDLYEIVAGDSVGASYLKNAKDEKKQANFWRWASVIFIALTAGWTAFAYSSGTSVLAESKILWTQILMGLPVTAVLLFGAAYSAKQSSIHRQNETRTRWFALEMKAIDPFISSLDDNDRKALKKTLSERLFAQNHHSQTGTEHRIIDEHAFGVVVKAIGDLLKKVR